MGKCHKVDKIEKNLKLIIRKTILIYDNLFYNYLIYTDRSEEFLIFIF